MKRFGLLATFFVVAIALTACTGKGNLLQTPGPLNTDSASPIVASESPIPEQLKADPTPTPQINTPQPEPTPRPERTDPLPASFLAGPVVSASSSPEDADTPRNTNRPNSNSSNNRGNSKPKNPANTNANVFVPNDSTTGSNEFVEDIGSSNNANVEPDDNSFIDNSIPEEDGPDESNEEAVAIETDSDYDEDLEEIE